MTHSPTVKHFLPLPIPQEIRNEVATYLDPFSLANAIRSGRLPYDLTSRALFGGIWTLLLSMKGVEELKNGLTEWGNAILIGSDLDRVYNLCLNSDNHPPCTPTHIILTWLDAEASISIREGRFKMPEYNVILWIKKPDMLFDANGITVDSFNNFIDNNRQTKVLYFKDNKYTIRLADMRPRERNHTRPVQFQLWFNLEIPYSTLCLQSWQRPRCIPSLPVK
ncbi:hypothetical protein M441DRAFT_48268 [Trichoderma asperellum CBS 433.97]|uniref:Uncharacterized protein n=1 Tax=Trichoderma asperellum (strain ATCC 204424 / CBS 433.97 / NBRC 101777) TaxID=1042311 RepID=A0A2T3Z6P6_TRIA4|nr:hypothetical protein M441DRAFT_48268 [Trichoderma asperellum CBS 433.97]PTB40430.1 hypothetical protein M441DRAFT_48268 [Trichoderma asperellum CBS 433.97]